MRLTKNCLKILLFAALTAGLSVSWGSAQPSSLSTDKTNAASNQPEITHLLNAPSAQYQRLNTVKMRATYLDARSAFKTGKKKTYKKWKASLVDYPLYPYLEFEEISKDLDSLPSVKVKAFLDQHSGTYLAEKLNKEWLKKLAKKKKWEEFLTYYYTDFGNNELACNHLTALYKTGKKEEALRKTKALWAVGRSQPDACDDIFEAWIKADNLTNDIAWQRFKLAVDKHKDSLAAFLTRYLDKDSKHWAQLYRQIHRKTDLLKQKSKLSKDNPKTKEVVIHGLKRKARRDAKAALDLWHEYQGIHDFNEAETAEVNRAIALRLATQFHPLAYQQLIQADPNTEDLELTEWRIRVAIRESKWQQVYNWIQLLPKEEKESPRWMYWQARSLDKSQAKLANSLMTSLSKERDYYGFLAAEKIGVSYSVNHTTIPLSQADVEAIEDIPSVKRALEFYVIGHTTSARREWLFAIEQMSHQELLAAANVAKRWGWYRQAIHCAVLSGHWDDLNLRFPMAFQDEIIFNSKAQNVETNLLFAIARQESAFMPDAKSPVGALGLLQLMPATARQTAKKMGMRYSNKRELLKPAKNIYLGSAYLSQLLDTFNGNRILATAAYNAGPYRVKQWQKNTKHSYPFDVWVENIPFSETRRYVQNVLTYAVIYSSKLGLRQQIILNHERNQDL